MTPSDPPEEAPSALSRLDRALAGFGHRRPEPPTETDTEAPVDLEPDVEPDEEPEAERKGAPEPEPETFDDIAAARTDLEEPLTTSRAPASSSSVLDIASALAAVEQLDAARDDDVDEAAEPRRSLEQALAAPPTDADARVLAAAAGSSHPDLSELDEPDEAVESYGRDADDVDDERAPLVASAAATPTRNRDNTPLPYFEVDDDAPPPPLPPPAATVEELRQSERDRTAPRNSSVVRTLAEIPILLIVAALIAFVVKTFLAQAYYIPSGSMLPQLQVDDRVVVSKLAYKAHDPRRGDIIVFDDPRPGVAKASEDERTGVSKWARKVGEGIGIVQPSTDEFIKRVVGLPGDTVSGHDGHVYVNGRKLIEPYLPDDVVTSDFPPTRVKPGRLWVMGDNRSGSADSRVFGQVKTDGIVGRALVKVWPFSHISFL